MTDFDNGAPFVPENNIDLTETAQQTAELSGGQVLARAGAALLVVGGGAGLAAIANNDAPQELGAGWAPIEGNTDVLCDKDNDRWSITVTGVGESDRGYDVDVVDSSVSNGGDKVIVDGEEHYASVIGRFPLGVGQASVSGTFEYDNTSDKNTKTVEKTASRPDGCDDTPETTEPPVETTEPPVETTEPPVETTEPPVETTEPPVVTTEPPVETTEPPVVTTTPTTPATTTSTTTSTTTTTTPATTTTVPVTTTTTPQATSTIPAGS